MSCRIRQEVPDQDRPAVRAVHLAAFPTPAEADVVDRLRGNSDPWWSFVAERDGAVVGHLLFTRVRLEPPPARGVNVYALGPMAVHPDAQGNGIGSTLADVAISELSRADADAIVVLGHPEWYPRFGFQPASHFGLALALDAPPGAFLALEVSNGCLPDGATVYYDPVFH